jgi:hypothetical protein
MARTTSSCADSRISTVVLWCTSFARFDGLVMLDIRVPQVITTRSRTGVAHSADICLKHLWSASANMYGNGSAGRASHAEIVPDDWPKVLQPGISRRAAISPSGGEIWRFRGWGDDAPAQARGSVGARPVETWCAAMCSATTDCV